jgi:uncharacterized protein DUF6338
VPNSLESAIVFVLVIAPGYLLVRGFSVGRTQIPPERDLHVLAEAVVASILWLVAVYLVFAGTIEDYGLLPRDDARLEAHGTDVARLLLLLMLLAPYVAGRIAGFSARWLSELTARALTWAAGKLGASESNGWPTRVARFWVKRMRTAAFITPPTAWDRFWRFIDPEKEESITVHLKDGVLVRGALRSVDRSPLPHRVELAYGQAYDEEGNEVALGWGDRGVYLEGSEIRAVYFE